MGSQGLCLALGSVFPFCLFRFYHGDAMGDFLLQGEIFFLSLGQSNLNGLAGLPIRQNPSTFEETCLLGA